MAGGFSEVSLAMFTALSPAGALTFALMAAYLLAHAKRMDQASWDRVSHAFLVPLGVVWMGFMASATHLGTPANALHAFAGIGRSPLSNEVLCTVVFLFVGGMYWLYTYKISYLKSLAQALLVCSIVASALMMWFTAFAYSVPTVPSWDTWHTPLNLWGLSFAAGTALASCVLGGLFGRDDRWPRVLRRISYVCVVGVVLLLGMHARFLAGVENNVAGAYQAVPWYGVVIVSYAAISLAGLYVLGKAARCEGWRGAVMGSLGCVLVFIATFLARLPFYFSYLSAGF